MAANGSRSKAGTMKNFHSIQAPLCKFISRMGLLAALVVSGFFVAMIPASAKECVHIMKAVGKTALRQSKAEEYAVQAFLNVAYQKFGKDAYRQWTQVPGRKMICQGGVRKTCVASGVPCRSSQAKTAKPYCPQLKSDNTNRYRASYQIALDSGRKIKASGYRDICIVRWRQTRGSLAILPAFPHRKLDCPRGMRYVERKGADICMQ